MYDTMTTSKYRQSDEEKGGGVDNKMLSKGRQKMTTWSVAAL
jgi:hypothetical protein